MSPKVELEEITVSPGAADVVKTAEDGKGFSKVTVTGDADLIAKNIRKGVDIFGVTGTLAEGVDLQSAAGLSKINVSKATFSADQGASSVRLQHSLGVIPKIAMILSKKFDTETASNALIFAAGENLYQNSGDCNSVVCFTSSWGSPMTSGQITFAISYLEFTAGSGYKLTAGTEYTIITLA